MQNCHPIEQPREKLLQLGPRALSEKDLLAVVLRTGYTGCGVLRLAHRLLKRFPQGALIRLPLQDLCRLKGMGMSRASVLVAALELFRRWEGTARSGDLTLDTPEQVWHEAGCLRGKRKEHFMAFYLDACSQPIYSETISIGTLTASLVHPREVFAPAIKHSAVNIILAHNHPSGCPDPSPEDREVTENLVNAGRILGIKILDHLIVTDRRYFSFRQHGFLS